MTAVQCTVEHYSVRTERPKKTPPAPADLAAAARSDAPSVQTLMTLFSDAGFTYTKEFMEKLCTDLQIHVERKDAAFAAAEDEPLPAPKPAAKPAKPAKAERSPFCDSLGCCGHCSTLHRAARSSALRRRSPRPSRAPSGSTSSASRSQKRTSGPDAEGLPHSW